MSEVVLGADVGGTFTDFFLAGPEGVRTWKRLSTPSEPERAVIDGAGEALGAGRFVHGSTVATNALLERKGPRTVLVTTKGFKDLLEIRRQTRPELYALEPVVAPHVVARGDAIEVEERLAADGSVVVELTGAEVERVVAAAKGSGGEAFAVCLLHGYRNGGHERRIVEALRSAGLAASASHEVLPELREYERASTTAANAFLQPTIRGYLERLETAAPGLRVIHSGGGLTGAAQAGEHPVSMVMSGPAGGVLGAMAVAKEAGFERIITLDMGGTSTDVALCDGAVPLRNAVEVDGMAIHAPMIDIVTVGAGGGSIASVDAGGALQVGPESAGADPGPACYGRGTRAAVSDANLVLGRLRAEVPLAGTLQLDGGRARVALDAVGMGSAEEAARAVVDVVNVNMARALRRVSLERGHDPADFTLVAFGGAGALHACELAESVGIERVLVPRHPGVLSALGMVTAPEAVERSRGLVVDIENGGQAIAAAVTELERETAHEFEQATGDQGTARWAADLRYAGQAHELRVTAEPVPGALAEAFHAAHLRQFGYNAPGRPVELVTLRCRVEGESRALPVVEVTGSASPKPVRVAEDAGVTLQVFERESVGPGAVIDGPAVVTQADATTYVADGWRATCDERGNLVLGPGR